MQTSIIHYLKSHSAYLSGEELSRRLKISRAAVWKYIEDLRGLGYMIEAVPHHGYHLVSSPDKLYEAEIQHGLKTKKFGRNITYFDSIDSTMREAFALAMQKAQEGTAVCADYQTKGRGRQGRSWVSPKGKGIYLSVILRPAILPGSASTLTLLAAVAVCEAIRKLTSLNVTIKWPNDILIGGKKLAGILTELNAEMDRVNFIILGIGINVHTSIKQLPPKATSLKEEGCVISRVALTQAVLEELEGLYHLFLQNKEKVIFNRWRALNSTLGKRIRVQDTNGFVEGLASDLDERGGLLIKTDKGTTIKRMSGDIIYV